MSKGIQTTLQYSLLFILIYLVVFLKLGSFHMRWWDESMFAVNTYEMLQNEKWFSLYFDGIPDLYNTKPTLVSWIQILFVKTFGYNELALRLPSAIAACLSITLLFKFIAKHFDYLWAWTTALILLTSYGFIHFHTARTADSDSLLTFFILISNLYFLEYILKPSSKYILLFFLFITLAFSVKLYAALLFIPAYIIILIYKRLFKQFTFNWSFLFGLSFFIFTAGSLIYLREIDTPGYLDKILFSYVSIIISVVESHRESTFFYFDNLLNYRYSIWFVFAVFGIILTFFHPKNERKNILLMCLLFICSYLTIIMISITKLEWYDMPLFPYLSILAAYPIYILINNTEVNGKTLSPLVKYFVLFVLTIYPYSIMFNKSQGNTIKSGEMELEANEIFLFEKIKNNESVNNIKVFSDSWNGSLLFYKYKLAELDQKIDIITNVNSITVNDRILVCDEELKDQLFKKFEITLIDNQHNSELFLVENNKQTPIYSLIPGTK